MTKIDLVTGFLGAGKTTLINKLLAVLKEREKIAVIVNDFGETNIDAQVLGQQELQIRELSAGCICCTLMGDLTGLLTALLEEKQLDRIIIEPSGISKTSEILQAVRRMEKLNLAEQGRVINLADCYNFAEYMECFGSFFTDQIKYASVHLLSHSEGQNKRDAVDRIHQISPGSVCYDGEWMHIDGELLVELAYSDLPKMQVSGQDSGIGPDGHGEECVFSSWSSAKLPKYRKEDLQRRLQQLAEGHCGQVLRAKGICPGWEGGYYHFNYLPGHSQINYLDKGLKSMVTVIGQGLKEVKLQEIFTAPIDK